MEGGNGNDNEQPEAHPVFSVEHIMRELVIPKCCWDTQVAIKKHAGYGGSFPILVMKIYIYLHGSSIQ